MTDTFAATRALYEGRIGLLPTMGYFHEGHLSLMDLLRGRCDTLVVSNFVNPTQFDKEADLAAYPRDVERDGELAAEHSVDIHFVPEVEEVYPPGSSTEVTVGAVALGMEGKYRPSHFVGVATVVAKLFAGLRPDIAVFGKKDAQQIAVLKGMVTDLRFPVEIVAAPLVREPDGLALSSRNVRLSRADREAALAISRGLFQAAMQIDAGERDAQRLEATVSRSISRLGADYVELVTADTMQPMSTLDGPAVLAVAAHVGEVRLIDNLSIEWSDAKPRPDRGLILDEPSRLGTLH
ncbi:MAG TPA: pantoate--beta-alanine ligase [Acidimicrobiia bacterium]|nr:pantoate--beta-alanine ligase [Acidimicrobiia bacterium]